MLKKAMHVLILLASLTAVGFAYAADDPTLHQVYQAAQSGRLDEAQRMMQTVLQDHPNSAKAHYVEAEILAKQGRLADASGELSTAERLQPGLAFAKPQAVQDLKARIASSPRRVSAAAGNPSGGAGFPWGMLLLGLASIVAITLIMRAITARNAQRQGNYPAYPNGAMPGQAGIPGQPGPYGAPGQAYGGGMAPMGGGMGSNIMSGLATGAAVGAGMVAGEALVHHFMDGNSSNPAAPAAGDTWGSSSDNMGGSDFGIADNSSSWDDSSSMADIGGGGGDDWS